MSTLSVVKKGLNSIAAPQLIGADYDTRSKEFWMLNQNGIDYKFTYSGHASSLKAYKTCPPLTSIINKKAQAYINGKSWILNASGRSRDKESTSEVANKFRKLRKQPNPFQSEKEFDAQQYVYLQLFGWCMMIIIKPVGFSPLDATAIWNIPPSMVNVEETQKSWLQAKKKGDIIKSVVIEWEGEKTTIKADDVYIIKDFVPNFKSLIFPESRVCSLELPINNIIGAYESRNVLINYRGALGIISPDQKDAGGSIKLLEEDKEQLQKDFANYGLKNRQWKFIISSASIKWSQIGISTRELMLFEEIQDSIMRICDQFNFPYPLIANEKFNNLGGSNTDPNKTLLYNEAIIPEAESIAEQWANIFRLEEAGLKLERDYSHVPAMQGDELKKAQARFSRNQGRQIEFYNNLCTLNEWRVYNGDDPLPTEHGDKYYYELVAMGWKFGSGGSAPAKPDQENGQEGQQEQQQQGNQS